MKYFLATLAILFYFIPTFVGTGKRNINAIFWLNVLLGWTVIGWVASLIWALSKDPPAPAVLVPSPAPAPAPANAPENPMLRAARLKKMRDEGLLTQEEFMQQIGQAG